ncbi:hypothetical protein Moror_3117 [Moniliophthora roreri MCA 2997]|uniref:G-protein coupled receptors family 1 profile domain-containing protein n=2 Tax=Moniliophthora roreri TaxID=221103 RepID=V2X731_MONRO|nr:hypothetical protein Moror_3117 [Moniliophthora roreri MCA 2997]KAI3614003.1 hypothetical protein WG66_010798 [Moniliophthora roreri]
MPLGSRGGGQGRLAPFIIFDVLHGSALFLLLLTILPPLVSKSVRRMKTWYALMVSSIMFSSSFLLLLGQQSGPSPAFGICVYQSGLIYATPATLAASALTFVIELHWRLCSAFTQIELNYARVTMLLFFPPIVHLSIFFLTLFFGLSHRSLVERLSNGMYCHVDSRVPTTVTGVTVVLMLIAMILMEFYTISYLWHRRKSCRDVRVNGSDGHYPFQSFIRVTLYTLIGGLGIVLVDLFVNTLSDDNDVALCLLAVVPLSVALLFGSQMDIITFYMCRRKKWSPPVGV